MDIEGFADPKGVLEGFNEKEGFDDVKGIVEVDIEDSLLVPEASPEGFVDIEDFTDPKGILENFNDE